MAAAKPKLRVDVPISLLEEHPDNPNEMTEGEFNMLVQNLQERGFTGNTIYCAFADPNDLEYFQQVRKQHKTDWPSIWALMAADDKKFRLVAGEHRMKGAAYLGMTEVPCTIDLDPDFDVTQQDLQVVRDNVIKGRMSPQKFMKLYKKYEADHSKAILAEMFGFADEAYLEELIAETEKGLPPEMKKAFKEGAAEIKTVDDLAKLLNHLFSTFGSTLPHGFMFLDYGGQDSVWLRISKKTLTALHAVGDQCVHNDRTIDDIVGGLVQLIANGKADKLLAELNEMSDPAGIPNGFKGLPTADMVETVASIQ